MIINFEKMNALLKQNTKKIELNDSNRNKMDVRAYLINAVTYNRPILELDYEIFSLDDIDWVDAELEAIPEEEEEDELDRDGEDNGWFFNRSMEDILYRFVSTKAKEYKKMNNKSFF